MTHNIISCSGWEDGAGNWIASAPCMKSRIGLVFLFFVIAIIRKWGGEEAGVNFNFVLSLIFGLAAYILVIFLTGNFKIAFVVGLLLSLIGGYGGGMFFGGEE